MAARSFPIPALGALSMSLAGCVSDDPIIGDWICTNLDGQQMPYTYSYEYSYGSYSYSEQIYYSVGMEVFSDLTGHLKLFNDGLSTYQGPYGEAKSHFSVTYFDRLTVEGSSRTEYDITVGEGQSALRLECTRDGDRLSCDDQDDPEAFIDFDADTDGVFGSGG